MHKGFRKSLFGFNTNDVLAYIAATDKVAKDKIDALTKQIDNLNKEIDALNARNENLSKIAEEYDSKKEQIKLMSDNIARIYVTAKTTSKILIDNANESRILIEEANKERLETLSDAQNSMEQVKSKLNTTANIYAKEITALCENLESIKSKIDENEKENETANIEFKKLVNQTV